MIGYFIYKFKMSFEESFHFVKQRRPHVKPNEGFREQLKKYSMERNNKWKWNKKQYLQSDEISVLIYFLYIFLFFIHMQLKHLFNENLWYKNRIKQSTCYMEKRKFFVAKSSE